MALKTLKITTLSENTAGLGGFLGEWGLSILVETGDLSLLLDTGQSISATNNADLLGIDLNCVDRIILSHGHYDHTGGLSYVLRRMVKTVPVTAHPDIWADKYSHREGQASRYIGIPYRRHLLESLGASFELHREPVKISGGITTSGEVPMVTEFEEVESYLMVREAGAFKPDELLDDQALIIETEAGLVVVLGCAHRGIINTLYHARRLTGVDRVYAVLGGCHLMDASRERVRLTIAALKEMGVRRLGVSHCTGLPAAFVMAGEFGDGFFFNNAGTVTTLP
ncbi:MAG: MBL fold metallo-hydrolase [Dehalococcoidales bacterium]|nr:MBL fold metallo-hydrolase [Dehalococcoidales bacterium]